MYRAYFSYPAVSSEYKFTMAGEDDTMQLSDDKNLNDWQNFKERGIATQDLLLLSHHLSTHKSSTDEVRACLELSDVDDQIARMVAAGVSKQKVEYQLLQKWWEKNNFKSTWGTLLSCLEQLKDISTLKEDIRKGLLDGIHGMYMSAYI